MPSEIGKYGTHKKLHLTKMTPPKMSLSKDIQKNSERLFATGPVNLKGNS